MQVKISNVMSLKTVIFFHNKLSEHVKHTHTHADTQRSQAAGRALDVAREWQQRSQQVKLTVRASKCTQICLVSAEKQERVSTQHASPITVSTQTRTHLSNAILICRCNTCVFESGVCSPALWTSGWTLQSLLLRYSSVVWMWSLHV